jgi:bifunctional enzyme CysN/CysC
MSWYSGPSLLDCLETIDVLEEATDKPFRFPVQWVNRAHLDFRGYAGTIVSGSARPGDTILVRPGASARIREITTFDGPLPVATCHQAVTLTLDEDLDIGRGDVLASSSDPPEHSDNFASDVIWMAEKPLIPRRSYLMRVGTRTTTAVVTHINHKLDVNTGAIIPADSLNLNDVGRCALATGGPVSFDRYSTNRATGCFILIDRANGATVAAGMIVENLRAGAMPQFQQSSVGRAERAKQKHQKPTILWFTGLPGAGKTTISNLVEQRLFRAGYHTMILDGDNIRQGINRDLGFSEPDRAENIRRTGEIAKLMVDAGLIVICSFISPYAAERNMIRESVHHDEFIEIFVDTPLDECMKRDPKALYQRAKAGKLKNLTGFDAPYEIPTDPDIVLSTVKHSAVELAGSVLDHLLSRAYIDHLT